MKKAKQWKNSMAAKKKASKRDTRKVESVEQVYHREVSEDLESTTLENAVYGSPIVDSDEESGKLIKSNHFEDFPILRQASGPSETPIGTNAQDEQKRISMPVENGVVNNKQGNQKVSPEGNVIPGSMIINHIIDTTEEDEEENYEEEDEDEEYYQTPATPPITPIETREEKLARFNRMVLADKNSQIPEVSYIYDLRGLHSEPALEKAVGQRLKFNKLQEQKVNLKRHCLSMDDLLLKSPPYPHLLIYPHESQQGTYSYLVTKKMRDNWNENFLNERKRFSFFDELMAKGHILDSLEVPARKSDLCYLVEADKLTLRKNVKFGRLCFKTKNMYLGKLRNWYFQGLGIYKWVDGTIYEGEFLKGIMHGEGKLVWPDGAVYEGQFVNGIRSGWGVYSNKNGHTYAGDWKNGIPEGNGKMWYDPLRGNSDFYDGEWKNGVQEGIGTRIYPNDDRYIGQWKEGLRNGRGSMVFLQERQIYKGEWRNGLTHGRGQHTWFLDRSSTCQYPTRHMYIGEFVDGVIQGMGRLLFANGSWFEGTWQNGQREGKGILVNPSGEMKFLMFQSNDIIGTNDIPLHSPSYECDFLSLVKSLFGKFNFVSVDEVSEVEKLANVTHKHLLEIRKLYERASKLGEWWGMPGHHPDWLHNPEPENKRKFHPGPKTEQGVGDGLHKNKQNKFLTPDNIYLVTRFGLWLVLKDCPGILSSVTTAEYDNIWSTVESISFQTKHNPFEPVYLWQFLQCLIIVSTVIYLEIPKRKKKWSFLGVESIPSDSLIITEETSTAGDPSSFQKIPHPVGISGGKSFASTMSKTSHIDSVLKLKLLYQEGSEETSGEDENYYESQEYEGEGEDWEWDPNSVDEIESDDIGELEGIASTPSRIRAARRTQHHQNRAKRLSKIAQPELGIATAFEKLITEKFIPYLEQQAGTHLPAIPTPLPSMADLYKSFHKTFKNKNHDIIKAVEFLQHVLPHNVEEQHPIYWYRSKESLATYANLSFMCNFYKTSRNPKEVVFEKLADDEAEANTEDNKLELGDVFLGDTLTNMDTFKEELKEELSKIHGGQRRGSIHVHGEGNTVFGINDVVEKDKPMNEQEIKNDDKDDITSGAFGEKDFTPKPILWKPKKNCIHVKKNKAAFKNLSAHDVFKVFRYLYPNVCGKSQEINLDFEMTFCDWFWCTSLIAKISADREFYAAMKDEEPTTSVSPNANSRVYAHTHSSRKPNLEHLHLIPVSPRSRVKSMPAVAGKSSTRAKARQHTS